MTANSFKILIFTPTPNTSVLSNNKVQAMKNIRAFESIQWIFQRRNTASARTITYSQIFHAKMSKQTFHLKIFYLLMLDCKYYFSISPRSNKSGRLNHKSSPHLAGAEFQELLQPLQKGARKTFVFIWREVKDHWNQELSFFYSTMRQSSKTCKEKFLSNFRSFFITSYLFFVLFIGKLKV